METFETKSVRGTVALGRRLAGRLSRGDCVAMVGELGAGKTVLVRGIAAGLGLADERLVASPTFVLVREYAASLTVYHVDLYRTADPEAELGALGLEEMLADGVALIEWADRAEKALPRPLWQIQIEITGRNSRRFLLRRIAD
ncbi:MAG: tRNA (adenosine(37)-N6)-threonylcarbamoyltransferase complex ATPase subunit type 1 TsaE [Planctomycetota bacterium]|nr:tRNA (adenosine(37)-N6)-threonylcarbamoyltransferase complex ATPase subunit type 1 TsaE [Planctomycetota bacterium]